MSFSSTPPPSYRSLPLDSETASDVRVESSAVRPEIFVYYRLYTRDGAIPCAKSVDDRDPYLGRINALHVTPPHTAESLIRFICKAEGKVHHWQFAKLFELGTIPSPKDKQEPVAILSGSGPGSDPQKPVAIVGNFHDKVITALCDVVYDEDSRWLNFKRSEVLTTSGQIHKEPYNGSGPYNAYFAENTRGETGYVEPANFNQL